MTQTKRHYVHLAENLAQYLPGGDTLDWRDRLFQDLTEHGTKIHVRQLDPNEEGPRIEIEGETYVAQAGIGFGNHDKLFVFRVQDLSVEKIRSQGKSYEAEFRLWRSGKTEELDQLDYLFPDTTSSQGPVNDQSLGDAERVQERASPLLIKRLQQIEGVVRALYRPDQTPTEPSNINDFLDQVRVPWRRFQLDQHVKVTVRCEQFLLGVVQPLELRDEERAELVGLFGFTMLNSFVGVRDAPSDERLRELLTQMAKLPMDFDTRCMIWAQSLGGLDAAALRKELYDSVPGLKVGNLSNPDSASSEWFSVLTDVLRDVGREAGDQDLVGLADDTQDDHAHEPLSMIKTWVDTLVFRDVAPAEELDPSVAPPPEVEPPLLVDAVAADERSSGRANTSEAAFNAWMWRLAETDLIGPTRAKAVEPAIALTDLLQSLPSEPPGGAVRGIQVFLEHFHTAVSGFEQSRGHVFAFIENFEEFTHTAQEAWEEADGIEGFDRARYVGEYSPQPKHLKEIVGLLNRHKDLQEFPKWLFPKLGDEAKTVDVVVLAENLADPECRGRVTVVLQHVDELGERRMARLLEPLADGDDFLPHVQGWFENARRFLVTTTNETREKVFERSNLDGSESLSPDHLASLVTLKDGLFADTAEELDGYFESVEPSQFSGTLLAFERALHNYHEQFGHAEKPKFAQLKYKVDADLASQQSEDENDYLTIEHNWVGETGARATAVFHQSNEEPYGTMKLPIVLRANEPIAQKITLRWTVSGRAWENWPRNWPPVSREKSIRIGEMGWRRQTGSDDFHYSQKIEIPMRKDGVASATGAVTVRAEDSETGREIASALLKWGEVRESFKDVIEKSPTVQIGGATDPAFVTDHPFGPQKRADEFLQQLMNGRNLAVVAPRRFGKTTLLEYLSEAAAKKKLLVAPRINCLESVTHGAFSHEVMWNGFRNACAEKWDLAISSELTAGLPLADAFDPLRRMAKSKKKKAVVLLFDEAQLLFSGESGPSVGDRLKTLLESDWSKDDKAGCTPLLVGLVGLPQLEVRGGANLMGMLRPDVTTALQEAELQSLIPLIQPWLETTREARETLADISGNLLILSELLKPLADQVKEDGRKWVNYDDVRAVEANLADILYKQPQATVGSYVRDVLNESDSVNEWEPCDSFPIAAALAATREKGAQTEQVVAGVLEKVNEWSRASNLENVELEYTADRVRGHLDALRTREVLQDTEFKSTFLEHWVRGYADRGPADNLEFQGALRRGAEQMIKLPRGWKKVEEGSDAKIYQARDGKYTYAYRVKTLETKEEQDQFAVDRQLFETLRQAIETRRPGTECIAKLVAVGLSANDSHEAVQQYHWIPGEDLSKYRSQWPAAKVIDIGIKLAGAVKFLHDAAVLHRDLRPRNVIYDEEKALPVLIDFGFSRRIVDELDTVRKGQYFAPEVRTGPSAAWDRPADIYALAETLFTVWDERDPSSAAELKELFEKARDSNPADRPDIDAFLTELQGLQQTLKLVEQSRDAWDSIQRILLADQRQDWFRRVLDKNKTILTNLFLRQVREKDVCPFVADFLNQVLEAYPSGEYSLRKLFEHPEVENRRHFEYVLQIRNYKGHGDAEKKPKVRQFLAKRANDQVKIVMSCVKEIQSRLDLENLTAFVEEIFEQSSS